MIPLSPWRQRGSSSQEEDGEAPAPQEWRCSPLDEAEDHLISKDWMNTKCSSWRGQDLES